MVPSSSLNETDMDIVVGSGPSGLAVTLALLARGRAVTMIDGGKVLESAAQKRQLAMAAQAPGDWSQQQIDIWQAGQFSSPPGQVRRYGSDFAQVPINDNLDKPPDWFGLRASQAVGGLSNIWGGAVLPSRQADITDWPISTDELAPHYKAVADVLPISGRSDRLDTLFPAYSMAAKTPLTPGPQGRRLLDRLDRMGDRLGRGGVHVGQARQAVADDCRYCGMCLHGCPWDQIFSASHGLNDLKKNPDFSHLPGRIATGFSQTSKGVQLRLKDGSTLQGDRVFLAAGVLQTAQIVLASQPDRQRGLTLLDSQHFFLPLLHRWRPDGRPQTDPHHTLAEVFIEMDDPAVSPFLTHTQIYGWNEFYAREMIAKHGKKLPGSAPLLRALSRRLMVAQTFLHSDHCAQMGLRLSPNGEKLSATLHENPETARVMAAAKNKLAKSLGPAGLIALKFASRAAEPGSSFHTGGSLPMSTTPTHLQTDPRGRLYGSNRVHVVDASVLPSIPATTITFSVMANAHRIGALS